jgi:hypothetical protein
MLTDLQAPSVQEVVRKHDQILIHDQMSNFEDFYQGFYSKYSEHILLRHAGAAEYQFMSSVKLTTKASTATPSRWALGTCEPEKKTI